MHSSRRTFLKQTGFALASLAAAPSIIHAKSARPIVITIFQRGAADGVSMVIPFGDKHYKRLRPQIAIPEPKAGSNESALDLDGFYGLHPALASLKPIYDQAQLAIVHAVGSPAQTRSHFDAQDFMESGRPGIKNVMDGWMNRYLQAQPLSDATPFRAVAFSSTTPRSLAGPAPTISMMRFADFGIRGGERSAELEEIFSTQYADTFEAVRMLRKANPQRYTPSPGVTYPATFYGQSLMQIGQLIKADVGLELAFAEIGGWDTHANQGAARGQLADRLKEFADGLAAFHRDLGDRMQDVVVLTMTEFGRSIRQNGSGGTDHGHAGCMFIAGGAVRGGKVYGRWPGLDDERLHERRDLALTTDFRDVIWEILVDHMRARDVSVVFPGFKPAAKLSMYA